LDKYMSHLITEPHQFGFKSNHSTEQCVFVLQQLVEFYKMHQSPVYVCYLDLSKAFDRVNHWLLFDKLLDRKFPVIIVRILHTWYASQNFFIQWGNSLSKPFQVVNGVRQGGILSPVLFNVFVNDLSLLLKSHNLGCRINGISYNHLMYADDTVLLAPSPYALQELILCCERFAENNELVFNPKKTKFMCFKPSSKSELHVPKLRINNTEIEHVTQQCYLGVMISDDCMHDVAINKERKLLYARGNRLIRLFKHCSDQVKVLLFKTYCSNLYCAALWCNFKTVNLGRLKIAHNTIFKLLMKARRCQSASRLFMDFNVPNVNVMYRKLCYSFYRRLYGSENNLVKNLVYSQFFFESSVYKIWVKELYSSK